VARTGPFFKNPHIQVSLAAGLSIIGLALASKYVTGEPLDYLELAVPPFVLTIFESVDARRRKDGRPRPRPLWWIAATFAATALVVLLNVR